MKRKSLVPALPALVLLLLLLVFPAQAEEVPANMPAETVTAEQQAAPEEGQPEAPAEAPAEVQPEMPAEGQPEAPAGEDAPGEMTPTDLCPHANVHEEVLFDTPEYRPLDAETHSISGRAVVIVICDDCGAELSSRIEENAEEVLPHVYRKGICALCGREEAASGACDGAPVPAVMESTWPMRPVDGADNLYACSLTEREVAAGGDIMVLQPSAGQVVLALQAGDLLPEMQESGADLIAELQQDGSRSVSVSVRLSTPDGTEYAPDRHRITLRIYGNGDRESLDVTYTDPSGSRGVEEAGWVTRGDDGYWSVTWLGDGNYQY